MSFRNNSILFIGATGCILPLLAVFNLFFGWLFFRPLMWLGIEIGLLLFMAINSRIMAFKMKSAVRKTKKVVDIEAEVLEEKDKLPKKY